MVEPSKNGGAASSAYQGERDNSAVSQLSHQTKKVSSFCPRAYQVDPHHSFHVFEDRENFFWFCPDPLGCDHAIILDGSISSCRARTAELNERSRERRSS